MRPGESLLILVEELLVSHLLPCAHVYRVQPSKIDPPRGVDHGQRGNLLFVRERDEVAVGTLLADRYVTRFRTDGPRPTDAERRVHLVEREVTVRPPEAPDAVCGTLLVVLAVETWE